MLINQLPQFMRLIDPPGRGPHRRNDSVEVIDRPVIFVSGPSFESIDEPGWLLGRCCFDISDLFPSADLGGADLRLDPHSSRPYWRLFPRVFQSVRGQACWICARVPASNSRTESNEALASTKLLSAWILVPATKPALTHWDTIWLKTATKTSWPQRLRALLKTL